MIGMGTIINAAFVLVGGALGFLFGKALKPRYQDIMVAGCGLSTIFIGAGGTLKQMFTLTDGVLGTQGEMMLVISMCLGGLLGEILNIEGGIERFGEWLKKKTGNERDSGFVNAFVTVELGVPPDVQLNTIFPSSE